MGGRIEFGRLRRTKAAPSGAEREVLMNKRVNTGTLRQQKLFSATGVERWLADLTTIVLQMAAEHGVNEVNPHLVRLQVNLLEYTDTQRGEFELGKDVSRETAK